MCNSQKRNEWKDAFQKAYITIMPIVRLFLPNVGTVLLLYVLVLAFVLRERINDFLFEHLNVYFSKSVSLLNDNAVVNWATSFFCIICGYFLIKRNYIKSKQYGWTIIISLFLAYYLLKDDFWTWATSPIGISYKILLLVILIALFACGSLRLLRLILNTPRKTDDNIKKEIGFSVTTSHDSLQETGWQPYVENLVSKMLETDLSNESFAIGVSGVWGSGKTTFLKAVERELKQKVYLLEFNPWNGESASQIYNDFFETLVLGLSVSSSQRKTINRYASLLSQVDALKPQARLFETILEGISPSISEAKEQAENVIASMPLPVVVVIDDLDRLEGAELMSVLKLIRITANFKNLVFIVAYDKDYISNALSGIGGENFLKKIIPLEICLPDYESYTREYHLYSELKRGLSDGSILKEIEYDVFRGARDHKISFYLPTFRDVKRFANLFCLDINSFIRTDTLSEINVRDFFFVELLHYYDVKAYQYLKTRPIELIPRTTNEKGKPVYTYMIIGTIKGVKSSEEVDKKKQAILKKYENGFEDILWRLFGSVAIEENNLIRYPVNFTKYFSFRINNDQISLNEFDGFLTITDTSEINKKIKEYCRGENQKRNSLYYHLISQTLDSSDKQKAFNVLYSLIELWKYSHFSIDEVGKTLLDKNANKEPGIIPEAFKDAVMAQIGSTPASVANGIQMLLTALVELDFIDQGDEDGYHVEYESLISWDSLIELSEINLMSILGDRIMPIQDITDKKSLFHQFIRRAVAKVGIELINDTDTTEYKRSLLFDKLKGLYSGKDNSAGLEAFFNNLDPRPNGVDDYDYPEDILAEEVGLNISNVFGDERGFRDFNTFIGTVFSGHIEEVNACLRRLSREPIEDV